MAFEDGHLGTWQENFSSLGEIGCARLIVGFVLFVVVVLLFWQFVLN